MIRSFMGMKEKVESHYIRLEGARALVNLEILCCN